MTKLPEGHLGAARLRVSSGSCRLAAKCSLEPIQETAAVTEGTRLWRTPWLPPYHHAERTTVKYGETRTNVAPTLANNSMKSNISVVTIFDSKSKIVIFAW